MWKATVRTASVAKLKMIELIPDIIGKVCKIGNNINILVNKLNMIC